MPTLPGGRFAIGVYAFWRTHVAALAEEMGCENPRLAAELVMALLAADLHDHLRRNLGIRPTDIRATVVAAVVAILR